MKNILAYILTPIYYLVFGLLLAIFHPVQMIGWHVWGYEGQKRAVEILNILIIKSQWVLGNRTKFIGLEKIPQGKPLIIVSNHQSQYDIPPVVWYFKKNYPKFISKIELGRGIPSISYNLRRGGSALIDRKNRSQAIKEIIKLGRAIEANNYSACIFPEGTRSKDGKVKKFKSGGIETLLKTSPSAMIVPFAIDGNYLIERTGFPMGVGIKATYTVLDPMERGSLSGEEITNMCEEAIKKALGQG
jgi:1-acyl-sn-glycerol-3-phosphate acyltransferase